MNSGTDEIIKIELSIDIFIKDEAYEYLFIIAFRMNEPFSLIEYGKTQLTLICKVECAILVFFTFSDHSCPHA